MSCRNHSHRAFSANSFHEPIWGDRARLRSRSARAPAGLDLPPIDHDFSPHPREVGRREVARLGPVVEHEGEVALSERPRKEEPDLEGRHQTLEDGARSRLVAYHLGPSPGGAFMRHPSRTRWGSYEPATSQCACGPGEVRESHLEWADSGIPELISITPEETYIKFR